MMNKILSSDKAKNGHDYFDFLSHESDEFSVSSLNPSSIPNQISGKYEITSERNLDFSTEYCEAYNVVDLADSNNTQNLYALVFKKSMPFRLMEIIKLKKIKSANLITPLDYGIAQVGNSESQNFVVILQKPKGESLRQIIAKGTKVDSAFVTQKFLPSVLNVLNFIHQSEIFHGSINPDNIYIDEAGNLLIDQCVGELTGYSQPTFYETVDRAQCSALGKSEGNAGIDYYALGMVIFFLISGRDFHNSDPQEIIKQKLFQGTFHFLNAAFLLSGQIADLIKGLVADQITLRWGAAEVDGFLQGRSYSTADLTDLTYFSRAIIFNGKEHYSKTSLAYDLSLNWDSAKEYIKQDKIKKWLENSSSEEKYVEAIELFGNSTSMKSLSQKLISLEDERLIKFLIILDPDGPVRYKNFVFYKEGVGPMLSHSIGFSHSETTQILAAMLYLNIFSIYEVLAQIYSKPYLNNCMIQINRCSEFLKKSEYGFGIERCLYDLNPTLPCQSSLVSSQFCIGLKDVLEFLNNAQLNFEDLVAKKTVSCFLASKVVLLTEIKNKELDHYPMVQRSRAYQILGIFAQAQRHAKIGSLMNLCNTIMESVRDVLDAALKSHSIKKLFFDKLATASQTGNIAELQKIALNSTHINDDMDGYTNALRSGAAIAKEIFSLDNKNAINHDIKRKSLRLAVKFSYLICGLIVLSIIMQSI